jgi:hypothetical protein
MQRKKKISPGIAATNEKMLGRKQSIKGDVVLADYGPEESLNESADIEWVNKVHTLRHCYLFGFYNSNVLFLFV